MALIKSEVIDGIVYDTYEWKHRNYEQMRLSANSPDSNFFYIIDTERGTNATPATTQDVNNLRQNLINRQNELNQSKESKNTMPKMNDTAASPNVVSFGIPGIVVMGGIIGLYLLSK